MALEKISIIIPMYNCEKYIKRCLDSLVNQTYKNMEIIVINDGSKDSSGEIVQTYVKKYSNVKLINKKNAGVSSARNLGIKESTGKYVAFVDSDDWCEKQMYSEMMKLTEKIDCDIICSGYKIDSYNGKVISEIKLNEVLLGKCEEEKSEVLHELGISYCFARLFKREIINKNNIKFNEDLSTGEDAIFTCEYLCYAKRIVAIDKAYYHYVRSNNQSLSTKYVGNIDTFINLVWTKLDELYLKYPSFKKLEHSDGSSKEINISKMYLYNNYRKGCNLNSAQRRKEISIYMNDSVINEQMKNHYPRSRKDKFYKLLSKIKSPLIMDSIYSLRIYLSSIGYIFTGIKK